MVSPSAITPSTVGTPSPHTDEAELVAQCLGGKFAVQEPDRVAAIQQLYSPSDGIWRKTRPLINNLNCQVTRTARLNSALTSWHAGAIRSERYTPIRGLMIEEGLSVRMVISVWLAARHDSSGALIVATDDDTG